MRKTFLVALALVLSGCATAPVKTAYDNTRAYNEPYDEVWTKAVRFFASHNIAIKNIAKDSGVIYAEAASFDPTYADCGSYPLMAPAQNAMTLNVFVQRVSSTQTQASVNSNYREVLVGPYNTVQRVDCQSRGVVEETILDAMQ